MRRPSLVPALAVVATLAAACSSGCAAPIDRAPHLGLTAPALPLDAPAASSWSEWNPTSPVAASLAPASPAPLRVGGPWISHVTLLGGGRWLDEDDWEPLEKQLTAGLELDESAAEDGNGYEAGVLYAADEDVLESKTYEAYAGFRHTFGEETEAWHPFLSAGLSAVYGELELPSPGSNPADDDIIFGAYARAGLLWDLSERVRIGLDYRHLFAQDYEFEVGGQDLERSGDNDQVLVSVGFEF
jgi:opacity protein-like surface antigen